MADRVVIPVEFGRSPLLSELRSRMESREWKIRNREARPTEDPDTWDWDALDALDREFEMMS